MRLKQIIKMDLEKVNNELTGKSAEDILKWAFDTFKDRIVFASSFGAEDVVVIDLISKINPSAKIITIDTGRLPDETYELMEDTRKKYNVELLTYFPDKSEVENLLDEKGYYSFRESLNNRKECCRIRKINPLRRVLKDCDAWITGLRKEQSVTRKDMNIVEEDPVFGVIKVNPILDWSLDDIWKYIKKNGISYNKLHDQNYPSIGCEPCTRAIKDGEDIRAGRWWWESPEQKECGLHAKKGGR